MFYKEPKNKGSYKDKQLELHVRQLLIVVIVQFYGITAHHTKIYYNNKRGFFSVALARHKRVKARTP